MTRDTDNPVTVNAADPTRLRTIFVGTGYLSQLSYLFKNNFEVAGRYSATVPFSSLYDNAAFPTLAERRTEQVEFGVTKYLVGHRLKIQGNVIYGNRTNMLDDSYVSSFWSTIFQIELGI
jgi:phosphate-selective porin OprO and OprP